MSIFNLAKELKQAGWSEDQIRTELRGTILLCGDSPTCGAVEEAIAFANKSVEVDRANQRGIQKNSSA